ncbi:MAG TPA: ethanolamine ammonia-lyase subunit EutC [Clostridia bacterium]|nr:ethanolamine ammonia-lyase subunit EutC [Clostridia bacterium]
MDEKYIEQIVNAVLNELKSTQDGQPNPTPISDIDEEVDASCVDIASKEVKAIPLIDEPTDPDALSRMMKRTSARIGVGRAGTRLKTQTMLALRADHASAKDSVLLDVNEKLIEEMGLFLVKTKCKDKDEFLTRPDIGKEFDSANENEIKNKCTPNADVQIYVSDGLSSRAIEANAANILPSMTEGLKSQGLKVGVPFFVKYGRVGAMDRISEITGAKVTCVLIGERPGLGTAESMSAYIAYMAKVGMPEAHRTVVSNIHSGGTNAVEAGAYIAEIIGKIVQNKASGVNLKK